MSALRRDVADGGSRPALRVRYAAVWGRGLDMEMERLTFAELDRRIEALPAGPESAMDRPAWVVGMDRIGFIGMLLGIAPAVLAQWMRPAEWMVIVAYAGLAITIMGFLPGFLRNIAMLFGALKRGHLDIVEQWDHDFGAFNDMLAWLMRHADDSLEQRLRFVRAAQARMAAKMGLIYGGTERLGILPLLVAGYVQLDALLNAGFDIPLWKALLGLFAVLAYASCLVLCRARIRLDLHAVLLSEALERKSRTGQARDRQ